MSIISATEFVATAGTALSAHSPPTGSGFVQHGSHAGAMVISPSGRTRNANSDRNHALYRDTTALGSADYSVEAIFKRYSFDVHWLNGVVARLVSGADTYYVARYKSQDSEVQLLKVVAGTETPLGTDFSLSPFFLTDNWPDGLGIKLTVTGTSLEVFTSTDNGSNWTSRITATDSAISAAGSGGLYLQQVDYDPGDTTGVVVERYALDGVAGGFLQSVGGTVAPAGDLTDFEIISDDPAGSVAPSGSLATQLLVLQLQSVAGAVTPTGTVATVLMGTQLKSIAGAIAPSGVVFASIFSPGGTGFPMRFLQPRTE